MSVLVYFVYFLFASVMPRFIISIRELYARELKGHCRGIDSGFGVFSHSISTQYGEVSAIAFAGVVSRQDQAVVDGDAENFEEAIQLQVTRDGARQV